jgi:hypothetical protein
MDKASIVAVIANRLRVKTLIHGQANISALKKRSRKPGKQQTRRFAAICLNTYNNKQGGNAMKIAVTINRCIQTGEYDYTTYRTTKVFDTKCSLDEIIDWYKSYCPGEDNFHINDLQFSMLEETL